MARASVNAVAVMIRVQADDREIAFIVEAYRRELGAFAAAWGLPVPGLALYPASHEQQVAEEAAIIFTRGSDVPDAYGYHTALGVAYWGYVDVALCAQDGEPLGRVFGHELFELLADASADRWVGPYKDGTSVAQEVSDPVARQSRPREITDPMLGTGTVEIAEYVFPAWFDPSVSAGTTLSSYGSVTAPLTDAPGGYHVTEIGGAVIAGPAARVKSYGRTMRRLSHPPRSEEPTPIQRPR